MWNKTTHSARPLRHSKKASFSCLSNCAVVIAFVQGGLLGTRSRCLFSWCFLIVIFSSWSDRRYGFWAEFVEAWIIFTFLRSWWRKNKQDETMMPLGRNNHSPAVNSVPANVAVFKNSSKSFSCVTDLRRDVESISVVYLKTHIEPWYRLKVLSTMLTFPDSNACRASLAFLLMMALPNPLGLGFLPLGACINSCNSWIVNIIGDIP